ncbi:MAG TPA: hypothetical protein VEV17_20500 [Bryobacteraceae bacterium]|nr:hypothetical protein [Bryobacteraceae bacterium]
MANFKWIIGSVLVLSAWGQQSTDQSAPPENRNVEQPKGSGVGKDIGSGAGNVGTGAAKGAGDAAKGVGKGAADLATLHPINAAGSVGKGAATAGKDVTVGTAKGAGKITRGIGKAFKKLF